MKNFIFCLCLVAGLNVSADESVKTNAVADLGTVVVEGTALSKYRPETVHGATFTDLPPEKVPTVVDTLTQDFIQEHNPTDLHDLLRYVPGIETGGKSLLIRQPGTFTIRGKGGTEPTINGVLPIGRGAGLFMDTFLMERVEIVKGPIGSLGGGQGTANNASGGGGSVNLYLKSARLDKDEINLQENTSIGKHTQRHRGMIDMNETFLNGKAAVRVVGTADYYEPTYIHEGSQEGARPRESFSLAPSFIFAPNEDVTFGVKSMFQYTDQPSYIGIPVYRGRPGGGYSWYESSCRRGDRSIYEGFMINPWLDWQVTDDWLLKFGASLMVASWEQTTREPYAGSGTELKNYFNTGMWSSGQKYMTSDFSESSTLYRNYNLYLRSTHEKELGWDIKNTFVVQPDVYCRESGADSATTTRYGITIQDAIEWKWFTLLGGVRYDHFYAQSYRTSAGVAKGSQTADAVSPRGGLTIQPLDWLVFFGNISQTQTPILGLRTIEGISKTKPWYATQYEGGVRVKPVEELWASVSAYRIEQENTPQMDRTTTIIESQEGRNTSRGVEFSLTGDISENWTVMAMYAFNYYTDRSVAPGEKGRDFERYPAHTFSFNTSYQFASGPLEDIVIGGGYRFRSKSYACMRGTYVDENMRFNPSHIFDINMAIPFTKFGGSENWTLTLGVRNLFGEKYFESARHYYECLVGEPRTFEIGLRAKF